MRPGSKQSNTCPTTQRGRSGWTTLEISGSSSTEGSWSLILGTFQPQANTYSIHPQHLMTMTKQLHGEEQIMIDQSIDYIRQRRTISLCTCTIKVGIVSVKLISQCSTVYNEQERVVGSPIVAAHDLQQLAAPMIPTDGLVCLPMGFVCVVFVHSWFQFHPWTGYLTPLPFWIYRCNTSEKTIL